MNRNLTIAIAIAAVGSLLTLSTHSSAESPRLFSAWQPYKVSSEELLRSAAFEGDLTEIKRLLAQGVSVNARDKEGWTPLIWAQAGNRTEAIALLLAKGADINAKDRMGCTALHQAATAGRESAMTVLLDHGAEVENVSQSGYTPLMDAALYGRAVAVELLLAHGADPNALNSKGDTAATLAEQRGHRNVAMLLVANGADPYLQSKRLQTALAGTTSRNRGPARVRLAGHMRNPQVLEDLCERCLAEQSDSRVRLVSEGANDVNAKLAEWCRKSGLGQGKESDDRETIGGRIQDRRAHARNLKRDGASYLVQEAIETWEQLQAKYPNADKRMRELSRKGISPDTLARKEPLLQKAMNIWTTLQSEHPQLAAQLLSIAGIGR